jgi:hypothetical protein
MKFCLTMEMDAVTGQLLKLEDPKTGVTIAAYAPGTELEWNGLPLKMKLVGVEDSKSEHVTLLKADIPAAYGAGASLDIRRVLVAGGVGLHSGRSQTLELYYEVRRVPHTVLGETLDAIWQPALEAPLRLDTFTVLAAPALRFGPATRMRALALGGSGPREHVSAEDGPVAEVVPWLQTGFRNVFPGQQTVNGALYYHLEGEPFVWVVARRPATGGQVEFGVNRHSYRFYWFKNFPLQDEVTMPAITFTWGKGLPEAERRLACMFDHYEEPQDWWFHTCWFWFHPPWTRNGTFDGMRRAADILMDEGGITGFGLLMHDIPAAGRDIDVGSPRSSPLLGGAARLQKAMESIRAKGGHSYAWISRHGHSASTPGFRESWAIRGVDGRPIRIRAGAERGVTIDVLNPADPTFLAYMKDWIRHYVLDLGIDGLFWDSGYQPIYPDFGNKPYLRHPGETLAAAQPFYDDLYRYGRSLSKDFFMWAEGISPDYPFNALSVDGAEKGDFSKNGLMQRLAHAGQNRLVWRSHWKHDLASGFVFVTPNCDIGWDGESLEPYKKMASDPVNRAVTQLVREKGVRDAIGLGNGLSLLDRHVVVSPGVRVDVEVPSDRCKGTVLVNVVTGDRITGVEGKGGMRFTAPVSGGVFELE